MGGGKNQIGELLRDSVPDEGNWQDIAAISLNQLREENGNIVTTGTTPVLVLANDFLSVKWAAGNTDAAYLIWQAGRELAFRSHRTSHVPYTRLRLTLALRMAAAVGPDTPAIAVTARARAFNGALKQAFTGVYKPRSVTSPEANAVTNQTNPLDYTFTFNDVVNADNLIIQPGDSVVFKVVPGAHGTDDLECWGIRLQAAMNPAYTDVSLRK